MLACLHVLGQPGFRVQETVQLGLNVLKDYRQGGENKGKQNSVNYSSRMQSEARIYATSEADELARVRPWPDWSSLFHFYMPYCFHQPFVIFTSRRSERHFSISSTLEIGDRELLGGLSWKTKQSAQGKKKRTHSAKPPAAGCSQRYPLVLHWRSGGQSDEADKKHN